MPFAPLAGEVIASAFPAARAASDILDKTVLNHTAAEKNKEPETPQLEAPATPEPEVLIPASGSNPTPIPTQTVETNPYDEILKLNELLKMGILT